MTEQLAGKSFLVTGGGSGLGEGVVRRMAARGAAVTLSGRRVDKLTTVADSVQADGGAPCRVVAGDVTVPADRERMISAAVEHGGGIDAVINAAGNMYRGPLSELAEEGITDVFASNTIGPVMLTQLALPHLKRSKGSVVFFGSVHTTRAFPGVSPYAATKGALEALTGVLAAELGQDGIRVNCVRPGGVLSEINERAGFIDREGAEQRLRGLASAHALGRIGTADEVAEAVEYLVLAQWTTGSLLTVDGGLGLGVTSA